MNVNKPLPLTPPTFLRKQVVDRARCRRALAPAYMARALQTEGKRRDAPAVPLVVSKRPDASVGDSPFVVLSIVLAFVGWFCAPLVGLALDTAEPVAVTVKAEPAPRRLFKVGDVSSPAVHARSVRVWGEGVWL